MPKLSQTSFPDVVSILQHRWPIDFEPRSTTQVRENGKRKLIDVLSTAIADCGTHELERAADMAAGLDGLCLSLIANNLSKWPRIDMPVGDGKSAVNEMHYAIRHLISIGAIHIAQFEEVPFYEWTYAGKRMVDYIKNANPKLIPVLSGKQV